MDENFTNSDILIKYLDDELLPEEKRKIELELKNDATMQQELKNLSFAKEAIKNFGLKQKVATIHLEMMGAMGVSPKPQQEVKVRSLFYTSMRVAAATLFITLTVALYQYVTITQDSLLSEMGLPYSLRINRSAEMETPIEQAYKQKNYTSVISQVETSKSANPKDLFLAGQSYYALKEYSKAAASFRLLVTSNSALGIDLFTEDSEYYLALSYIKLNEIKLAYPIFKDIHLDSSHLYHEKITNRVMRRLRLLIWKQ